RRDGVFYIKLCAHSQTKTCLHSARGRINPTYGSREDRRSGDEEVTGTSQPAGLFERLKVQRAATANNGSVVPGAPRGPLLRRHGDGAIKTTSDFDDRQF